MKRQLIPFLFPLALTACQDVEQPTVVLTQEQWAEVQKHILTEEPQPKYRVGARFGDKIELIGFDLTEPLIAGKPATFTWYWRALEDVSENWKVFVHLDSSARPFRQNLDHVPVKDMFPTNRWKKGNIVKDIQQVTLRPDWPGGAAIPYVGFYRGDQRLKPGGPAPLTQEAQPRVIGPTLQVQGSAASEEPKPTYSLRALKNEDTTITVDGKLDEAFWEKLPKLTLFPFGNAPKSATIVQAAITEDALLLGAQLEDAHIWGTLQNRDDQTWTEEVLELFLDVNGDGEDYLELQVTPQGTVFDANFKKRLGRGEGSREDQIAAAKAFNLEGLEVKVNVDGTLNNDADQDKGWTVELKIPLASIPAMTTPVSPKSRWAVNVYRFDRPAPKTTHAYGWSTGPRGDFHQVDKFGAWEVTSALPFEKSGINPDLLRKVQQQVNLRVQPTIPSQVTPTELQKLKNQGAQEGSTETTPQND